MQLTHTIGQIVHDYWLITVSFLVVFIPMLRMAYRFQRERQAELEQLAEDKRRSLHGSTDCIEQQAGGRMSTHRNPSRVKTMNPRTWALRDWMNFCAAIPALFSLGTLAVCGVLLLMFWVIFSGYAVMLAGLVVMFLSAAVLTRAAIRNGSK